MINRFIGLILIFLSVLLVIGLVLTPVIVTEVMGGLQSAMVGHQCIYAPETYLAVYVVMLTKCAGETMIVFSSALIIGKVGLWLRKD